MPIYYFKVIFKVAGKPRARHCKTEPGRSLALVGPGTINTAQKGLPGSNALAQLVMSQMLKTLTFCQCYKNDFWQR